MKEFIDYRRTDGDSINGAGLQITYTFTSFNITEIDKLAEWCEKHIGGGLQIEGVAIKED